MERNKKRVLQTNEKPARNQTLQKKSHQRDKHMGCPPCKKFWTILKMEEGVTQINGPEDKKNDDDVIRPYIREIT